MLSALLASRMLSATAAVLTRISHAGMRPGLSDRLDAVQFLIHDTDPELDGVRDRGQRIELARHLSVQVANALGWAGRTGRVQHGGQVVRAGLGREGRSRGGEPRQGRDGADRGAAGLDREAD